jgi:hypothetical protein
MIIHTEIEGRSATLQYLTLERVPTTEEKAEMVYVVFDDDGSSMWAFPADDDAEDDDEPEE